MTALLRAVYQLDLLSPALRARPMSEHITKATEAAEQGDKGRTSCKHTLPNIALLPLLPIIAG